MRYRGKTAFITGASRGIGLAIALRLAQEGANIAIAAKTAEAHPKLPGTIHSAAEAVEAAGGKALALTVDVREEEQVVAALAKTADRFGGIDIVINNASAISLTTSDATEMRRFDLMHQVNTRGTYLTTKHAVTYLRRSDNPHVLMLCPPLNLREEWFARHLAYSLAKFGMSLCVLGFAAELADHGIAVNGLWPRTTIATSAVRNLLGGDAMMRASRTPQIMADAAHAIFAKSSREFTGRFLLDDAVLAEEGLRQFDHYRVDPSVPLQIDMFVPENEPLPIGVTLDAVVPLSGQAAG